MRDSSAWSRRFIGKFPTTKFWRRYIRRIILRAPSGGCGTFLCIASATLPSRSGSEAIQGCACGMRLVNVSKCFI
jgi:hypothetical protein